MRNYILYPDGPLHATGFVYPKTTTLFFDRVWIPMGLLDINSNEAQSISILRKNNRRDFLQQFNLTYDDGARAYMMGVESNLRRPFKKTDNLSEIEYYSSHYRNMAIKEYAESVARRFGVNVIPVYHDATQFEKETKLFPENTQSKVISICIEKFPMINEENLEWEQIAEFKSDSASNDSLKRFHRWMRLELEGKSKNEIEDIILRDFEDYRSSLKKHGILTVTGAISTVVAAVPSIINVINGTGDYLPVSISLAAGISIYSINKAVELLDLKRKPIAYIYDMIK